MNTTLGAIVMILAVVQAASPSKTIRTGANAAHVSAKDTDNFEKLAGGKCDCEMMQLKVICEKRMCAAK